MAEHNPTTRHSPTTWARLLFGKCYEELTDSEVSAVWEAVANQESEG